MTTSETPANSWQDSPGAFRAQYAGTCVVCGGTIRVGESIQKNEIGYAHIFHPDGPDAEDIMTLQDLESVD